MWKSINKKRKEKSVRISLNPSSADASDWEGKSSFFFIYFKRFIPFAKDLCVKIISYENIQLFSFYSLNFSEILERIFFRESVHRKSSFTHTGITLSIVYSLITFNGIFFRVWDIDFEYLYFWDFMSVHIVFVIIYYFSKNLFYL